MPEDLNLSYIEYKTIDEVKLVEMTVAGTFRQKDLLTLSPNERLSNI